MSDPRGGASSWLVDLIMKPGTSVQLVPAINVVLCILVILLGYLVANGEASIHVYVMGFLSIGLMASVNWFISEFRKEKKKQLEEGATASVVDAAGREKAD